MKHSDFNPVVEKIRLITCTGVLAIAMIATSHAQSNNESEAGDVKINSIDCTDVEVKYEDDPTLTEAEKLLLMEQAFYRSLSKFDACQDSTANSSSASTSSSSGSGSGDGSDGNDTGGGDGNAATTSTASSDMSGTEAPQETETIGSSSSWSDPDAENSEATSVTEKTGVIEPVNENDESDIAATGQNQTEGGREQNLDNGKPPEDIPAADNDSVLEAQIRQAAMAETDPTIKKRLWNEYRKYKGLPQVN